MGNNFVSWKSKKKQAMLARSSAGGEYMAMCNVCCETIWILKVLAALQVNVNLPIEMNCDNSSE